jgi:hypothetical protein
MADNRKIKNTRNQDSQLFKQLTKLFSGPLANYNQQTQSRYRRTQLDKFKFQSAQGLEFKKAEYLAYENISTKTMHAQNRADRYIDFDQMEYMPEIASALDIYADEMTTNNELTAMLKVKCPNEEIKSILETLYFKTLNLESNLFSWSRNMCKYGDFFLYLDIDDKLGITSGIGLPANQIERMEGKDKTNSNYVQFQWNSGGLTFENWQIAHFRILGNDKHSPYGTSVLDPARRIWRQLTLLEDAMMAYRITRSPERKVFYIDVGNVPPEDIEQYMQKVMTQMKRNQILDSNTGRVDLRYNPTSVDEDYFIPVRGGVNNTKIEALPGGQFASAIEDVKYLRDKLFAALKVPMSYLIRGEGATEDKTTLAQKDIRFARTIQRLQRVVISELEKIGIVHLYTLGFRGTDLISFKLSLNNPSKIAALQELEHWKVKFDVASAATEGYFSKHWVAQNIFGMSDEQIVKIQREMFFDKKFAASLEQVGQPQEAAAGGGGGGGLGLDIGGGETPASEAEAPEGGAEGGAEEPESMLLATPQGGGGEAAGAAPAPAEPAPGRRDDRAHVTAGSKGKEYLLRRYVGGDRRDSGARKRSMRSSGGESFAGANKINPGIRDLSSMARGIYETNDSNYDNEELELFRTNKEIKQLIENLEKSTNARKSES